MAIVGITQDWQKQLFNQQLDDHQIEYFQDLDQIPAHAEYQVLSVFVHHTVDAQVINNLPNLQLITVRSTGFDNVDLKLATEKGVLVANVPSYGSHTVAEFTFGLLLALARKIPQGVNQVKNDKNFSFEGLGGIDLIDKTIGVIGTGRIGANAIRIAQGFGMKVLAFDIFPNQELAAKMRFEYVAMEELLKQSDVVTIHCPATPQTTHLINKDNIGLMKKQALLINTARGTIIETEALYNALKDGQIAGAAVDVLENEASLDQFERQLIDLPNVLVTPHIAFYTEEAEMTILQTTIDNINQFALGKAQNIVNKD